MDGSKTLLQIINGIGQHQAIGIQYPCPRCGGQMNTILSRNALSRRATVHICSNCGTDETLRDAAGMTPLPFELWACRTLWESEEE